MRVLVDTDVLLDVALNREPHVSDSIEIFRWVADGGEAAIAWHSLPNCAYLLKGGRRFLGKLLTLFEVSTVGTADACRALALPMADLEDAFQAAAAISWGADYIITRNLSDYRRSPVSAISPSAFLKKIKSI